MCDNVDVAEIVRLGDADVADRLVAALLLAGADAARTGVLTILVRGGDEDLRTELVFFLRAWIGTGLGIAFEIETA